MEDVISIDSQDEGQAPPSGERFSLPPMTVQRASALIDKFTRDPQFLANPYTMHAANAVLNQATKVVSMHLQLERAKNSSLAAREEQTMVAKQVKDAAEIVRSNPGATLSDGRKVSSLWVKGQNEQSPIMDVSLLGEISALHGEHVTKNPLGPFGKSMFDREQFSKTHTPEQLVEYDRLAEKAKTREGVDPADARLYDIADEAEAEGNMRKAEGLRAIATEHGRGKGITVRSPIEKQEAEVAGLKASVIQAKRFALATPDDPNLKSNANALQTRLAGSEAKLSELRKQSATSPATPAAAPAASAPANTTVTTKDQFDALAPGTIYTGKDGKQYQKP